MRICWRSTPTGTCPTTCVKTTQHWTSSRQLWPTEVGEKKNDRRSSATCFWQMSADRFDKKDEGFSMVNNYTIKGSVPCILSSILCQLDLTFNIPSFCEVESLSDMRLIQDNHMLLFKKLKTPVECYCAWQALHSRSALEFLDKSRFLSGIDFAISEMTADKFCQLCLESFQCFSFSRKLK